MSANGIYYQPQCGIKVIVWSLAEVLFSWKKKIRDYKRDTQLVAKWYPSDIILSGY